MKTDEWNPVEDEEPRKQWETAFRTLFSGPRDGDPTFVAKNIDGDDSLFRYVRGYEIASKIVLEQLATRQEQDYLVFPSIFLLRHAVELRLKFLVHRAYELRVFSGPLPPDLWHTHKLPVLEVHARAAIAEAGWFDSATLKVWDEARELLELWELADPNGLRFRYMRGTDGTPDSVDHPIDPRPAFIRAEPLLRMLEGFDCALDEARDALAEEYANRHQDSDEPPDYS